MKNWIKRYLWNMTGATIAVVLLLNAVLYYFAAVYRPTPRTAATTTTSAPTTDIKDGIHLPTGLKAAEGFEVVSVTCTPCHSAKLITQNRATREGWEEMIRWMQRTQNLWDLGEQEKIILDYLAANYAPEQTGRRKPLNDIVWYKLKN